MQAVIFWWGREVVSAQWGVPYQCLRKKGGERGKKALALGQKMDRQTRVFIAQLLQYLLLLPTPKFNCMHRDIIDASFCRVYKSISYYCIFSGLRMPFKIILGLLGVFPSYWNPLEISPHPKKSCSLPYRQLSKIPSAKSKKKVLWFGVFLVNFIKWSGPKLSKKSLFYCTACQIKFLKLEEPKISI